MTPSRGSRLRLVVFGALVLVLAWGLGSRERAHPDAERQAPADASAKRSRDGKHPARRVHARSEPHTATISGNIRDPRGRGIANARVCAFAEFGRARRLGDARPRCVVTEGDGHYRLAELPAVLTSVGASAPAFRPGRSQALALSPDSTVERVDVVLEPGGVALRGVVTDIAGGEIEGAWVIAREHRGQAGAGLVAAPSNSLGEFELWLAPGEARINADADGYASLAQRPVVAPSDRVEIVLTPESVLVGRVVDAELGTPVAGAVVDAGSRDARPRTVRTGADGRFRLDRLAPGVYAPTAVAERGYGETKSEVLLGLGETSSEIVIAMHPAVGVRGEIVVSGSERRCRHGGVGLVARSSPTAQRWAATDERGRVELLGVLPGAYAVHVECDDHLGHAEYPEIVVASEDLELVWEVDAGLTVAGDVVDDGGAPVSGAYVRATMAAGARRLAESDAEGRFVFAGLGSGRYEVSVWSATGAARMAPIEVALAERDLDELRLVVAATGRIVGHVVDRDARPIAGVEVWAELDDASTSVRADAAGQFVFGDLRPGPVRLRATASAASEAEVEVELRAHEELDLELVVPAHDGRVRGRVVDEHGAAILDAFVEATVPTAAPAHGSLQTVLVDQDGRFELTELPPNELVIRAWSDGRGQTRREGVMVGDELVLELVEVGELAGTVSLTDGTIPEHFEISAWDPGSDVQRTASFLRTGGEWTLPGVSPGTYEIRATTGAGTGVRRVLLGPGELRDDIVMLVELPDSSN